MKINNLKCADKEMCRFYNLSDKASCPPLLEEAGLRFLFQLLIINKVAGLIGGSRLFIFGRYVVNADFPNRAPRSLLLLLGIYILLRLRNYFFEYRRQH